MTQMDDAVSRAFDRLCQLAGLSRARQKPVEIRPVRGRLGAGGEGGQDAQQLLAQGAHQGLEGRGIR